MATKGISLSYFFVLSSSFYSHFSQVFSFQLHIFSELEKLVRMDIVHGTFLHWTPLSPAQEPTEKREKLWIIFLLVANLCIR